MNSARNCSFVYFSICKKTKNGVCLFKAIPQSAKQQARGIDRFLACLWDRGTPLGFQSWKTDGKRSTSDLGEHLVVFVSQKRWFQVYSSDYESTMKALMLEQLTVLHNTPLRSCCHPIDPDGKRLLHACCDLKCVLRGIYNLLYL